jgi:ABC-type transport system involved in cytochrome c biogenesis permease component
MWWRRVLTTAVALGVSAFAYLVVSQWGVPSFIGQQLFNGISGFGMLYAVLAGPLATVDCLSRERREGTLGLLFLTDLGSADVVLGKMAAVSLDMMLGLVALLPIVAVPMMLGGASWLQVASVAAGLFNIMLLSLAAGACASSFVSSGRAALGMTVLFLGLLTLGLPMLVGGVVGLSMNNSSAPWFYMFCPVYTMFCCLVSRPGPALWRAWGFWLNMGAMHALTWVLLVAACVRTRNSWRDVGDSTRTGRWRQVLERWSKGRSGQSLVWRRLMLNRNPVGWLEGRDWLQEKVIWALLLAILVFCAVEHLCSPQQWPEENYVLVWGLYAHYILCVWLAIQAPRRLADDKQSGALELLLCTPTQPREIVNGSMWVLRRRFGGAFLSLLAVAAFLGYAYYSEHGGWEAFFGSRMQEPVLWGLAVFSLQLLSFARVGLYQGLVQSNSLRATFLLVFKLGLLPWMLFAVFMLTCEMGSRYLGVPRNVSDDFAIASWAGIHLVLCGLFLRRANWQLRHNFRALAAQTKLPARWKRWLPVRAH